MDLQFVALCLPQDEKRLVAFLTGELWPFHVNEQLSAQQVFSMLQERKFDGENHSSFWILNQARQDVGFVRLYDLEDVDDGYPLFDLRIRKSFRGQGIGRMAVQWLTRFLFEKYSQLERIVGTTRVDNLAMRRLFRSCGYAKEGHYRKDWCTSDGRRLDTVRYGILREDWLSGKLSPVDWNDEA